MLRPFFPELVMCTELLSFEHPTVLLFYLGAQIYTCYCCSNEDTFAYCCKVISFSRTKCAIIVSVHMHVYIFGCMNKK